MTTASCQLPADALSLRFVVEPQAQEALAGKSFVVDFYDKDGVLLPAASRLWPLRLSLFGDMRVGLPQWPQGAAMYQVHVQGDPYYAAYVVYNETEPFAGALGTASAAVFRFVLLTDMSTRAALMVNFVLVPLTLSGKRVLPKAPAS